MCIISVKTNVSNFKNTYMLCYTSERKRGRERERKGKKKHLNTPHAYTVKIKWGKESRTNEMITSKTVCAEQRFMNITMHWNRKRNRIKAHHNSEVYAWKGAWDRWSGEHMHKRTHLLISGFAFVKMLISSGRSRLKQRAHTYSHTGHTAREMFIAHGK